MQKERLDALSDGIFAIVMTLLVIELKVPVLHEAVTSRELAHVIGEEYPLFLSFLLSFALLFTYWRAHSSFMSSYAKNVDKVLTNINAIFFFFVALIPFSTHLLGRYSDNQFAVFVIGINTVAIGFTLYIMRNYIIKAKTIENAAVERKDIRHSTIRILVPVFCALLAIILSFFNITAALLLFTIAILFNFLPSSTVLFDRIFYNKYLRKEEKRKS